MDTRNSLKLAFLLFLIISIDMCMCNESKLDEDYSYLRCNYDKDCQRPIVKKNLHNCPPNRPIICWDETYMMMESEAYCKTDHDYRKPSIVKELACPIQQPPVCFNNECACDPSNPPTQIVQSR
ncbi:hypothetical protein P8452_19153 [Trifolium repens]|nr:hypothetical protein P8452_19153 [Trifolium repens]